MKALTLWQPWAHAIAHLGKRVENRTWAPPASVIGRLLAIHAGKNVDIEAVEWMLDVAAWPTKEVDGRAFVRGAVIAIATLKCLIWSCADVPVGQDLWWRGPIGWLLTDVIAIDPVPCRGAQGLWDLPAEVESAVMEAVQRARPAR